MKYGILYLLTFLNLALALDAGDVLSQSAHWPYRVALTQDHTVANHELKRGLTGVLVRAEENHNGETMVRIDFGRWGRQALPVSLTDLEERIDRVKSGELSKLMPNYVHMLANKFVLLRPGLNYKLELQEFEDCKGFIFLYPNSREGMTALMDQANDDESLEGYVTLVLPAFEYDGEQLRREIREHPLNAGILFPHLLEPYRQTLSHQADGSDALIVTDLDGLILRREAVVTSL